MNQFHNRTINVEIRTRLISASGGRFPRARLQPIEQRRVRFALISAFFAEIKASVPLLPTQRIRKKRNVLGTSIAERPLEIEEREEFGHWEIDTVGGKKSDDNALLTIIERKTRFYYAIKIDDQDHDSVDHGIKQLQNFYGELFPQVFKTITSDSGSEFSNLLASLEGIMDVYFARPYAFHERGSNERHNGLLRRYIPKGKAISDYSRHTIKRLIIYRERF